jgi:hypothetical protein
MQLRRMARRCRDAAETAKDPSERKELVALAAECEEQAQAREAALEAVDAEAD